MAGGFEVVEAAEAFTETIHLDDEAGEKIGAADAAAMGGEVRQSCLLEGCRILPKEEIKLQSEIKWTTILPQTKLSADNEQYFEDEIADTGPFTHVRLSIFPDGGISRMRVWGRIKK